MANMKEFKQLVRSNICGDGYDAQERADEIIDYVKMNFCKGYKVSPVVHGHWISHNIELYDECSECHQFTDRPLMCCDGSPSTRYEQHPYCPWCGAKMTGDFIYGLETGERKDGEQDEQDPS